MARMQLTKLQRRVLALLEEAGEDRLTALMNSAGKPQGVTSEVELMRVAIAGLVAADYLVFARRDAVSHHLIPSAASEAATLLKTFANLVTWSPDERLWVSAGQSHDLEVLLTDSGIELARRVLLEDGWPTEPLDRYDQ